MKLKTKVINDYIIPTPPVTYLNLVCVMKRKDYIYEVF